MENNEKKLEAKEFTPIFQRPGVKRWLRKVGIPIFYVIFCVGWIVLWVSSQLWWAGWHHYDRGGGVNIYAPMVPSEMEEALTDFTWAGRVNPLSADAFNYQGEALTYLGRYHEALERFDLTLRFHPCNFTAHYGKAFAYLKLKDYGPMVDELHRCAGVMNSQVRFSENFASVRHEPFMAEFDKQYSAE
jgi:tetratricopeptide (TPR) repeat protein